MAGGLERAMSWESERRFSKDPPPAVIYPLAIPRPFHNLYMAG
jgi:hypothetical protein